MGNKNANIHRFCSAFSGWTYSKSPSMLNETIECDYRIYNSMSFIWSLQYIDVYVLSHFCEQRCSVSFAWFFSLFAGCCCLGLVWVNSEGKYCCTTHTTTTTTMRELQQWTQLHSIHTHGMLNFIRFECIGGHKLNVFKLNFMQNTRACLPHTHTHTHATPPTSGAMVVVILPFH